MKSFSFLLLVGLICILDETGGEGMVYYVLPTEPLSSCPGNSSCPPGQLCHTMDYFAEHSSEFFSSDQVSVTLIFMCGVHNYTKDLTVQNLHSFVMKGSAESRQNVIIDHQFTEQSGKPNCTIIQFFNVSFMNITNLTMRCPAINLMESYITVKSSNFYGYPGIEERLSFINIIGRSSQALLNNCSFKENCFVRSNFSDGIMVNNSTFQSYRHRFYSITEAFSSVVTLTGNVNFTDSVTGFNWSYYSSGTAVFLRTTHPEFKSSLNITADATVYFVNLASNNHGGAVYGENGTIHIGAKAMVAFIHNTAVTYGGAVCLIHGNITVGVESNVMFTYNYAYLGGAMWPSQVTLNIDTNASLRFSHNCAGLSGGAVELLNGELIVNNANLNFNNNSAAYGGAILLIKSTMHIDTDAIQFCNNKGSQGGAMYFRYGILYIKTNKSMKVFTNTAYTRGGAIFIESATSSSIIVGDSANLLLYNNSALQGGALGILQSSFPITIGYQSSIQFINNTALNIGGAVFSQSATPCTFMITDYSAKVHFKGNKAKDGIGHHMYGASVRDATCDTIHIQLANKQGKPHCWHKNEVPDRYISVSFDPSQNETLSPVSSAPQRVCLCDSNGTKPQCANISQIFTHIHIYHGETFTLSTCIVGYDFGITVGTIHARFLNSHHFPQLEKLQYSRLISNTERCYPLDYTVYSRRSNELLLLQTSDLQETAYDIHTYKDEIKGVITDYVSHNQFGCLDYDLLTTPVFINVTFIPGCPAGLTLNNNTAACSCYPVLAKDGFKCSIRKTTGFLVWNSTVWVNATFNESHSTGIIYSRSCPLLYCKSGNKTINIGDDPNKQCTSNRTGILCGACMENFSLAIGSSRCIECPNSHNVALLLAFAAAGVFLVFFILALNLTVTQGLINGIIFYANIVWAYKIILFPSEIQENHWLVFLQAFVAWLNLDFGIETCFFVGLDAYWKTWLQFLFPLYIWTIAGIITVACRYSSCLTNLVGSRAVPLLATLFFLSYMKLLRTIIDATFIAVIAQYPQNTSYAVWYLDGSLRYCWHPHIYLFIAAIATLVFLWLPYTLLLLLIQPLRRVSHLRPLKWINKLAPVFDAYFSPLKDKHQYWFGAMLLVRGILLLILTVTSIAKPTINVLVLLITMIFLVIIILIKNVYRRKKLKLLKSATLWNLIILTAGTLYNWESIMVRMILLEVSIGITFAQFCVIVVLSLIKLCVSAGWRCRRNQSYDIIYENINDDIAHERIEDPELEPLINCTARPITVAASDKYTATATQVNS